MKNTDVITVHNLLIMDESGSMLSIYNAALSGANETVQTIRAAQHDYPNQDHRFSFVTFNTTGPGLGKKWYPIKTIFEDVPIAAVRNLTPRDYNPVSGTPLYDAMGIAVNNLRPYVKRGDKVLVTVITDGYENSSRLYSGYDIKQLVDELREQGWTFVYIGANQDAVEVAKRLSINNALDFDCTPEEADIMFSKHRKSSINWCKKIYDLGSDFCSDEEFFEK